MRFFYFTLHARCCNPAASHERNASQTLEIKRREGLVLSNPLNKFSIPTRSLKTITGASNRCKCSFLESSRLRPNQFTQNIKLKALPAYYGYYLSLWCGLPALIIFGCWSLFEPTIIKVLILKQMLITSLWKNV